MKLHDGHREEMREMQMAREDMIERVARAIETSGLSLNYETNETAQRDLMGAARAAIKAMREPTEAMLDAGLDESGWRVEPYTAPRESGVPIECDMSAEDAAEINKAGLQAHADTWRAMIDAALKSA